MSYTKIFFVVAITMALSIAVTMRSPNTVKKQETVPSHSEVLPTPSKRVSRFLADEGRNRRAADRCHKDNEICSIVAGKNTTCCNNKCVDLSTDNKNCGSCKNKCKFTETCCRGECVNVAFDKRHCGFCNNRCKQGQYCVYGLCGYA